MVFLSARGEIGDLNVNKRGGQVSDLRALRRVEGGEVDRGGRAGQRADHRGALPDMLQRNGQRAAQFGRVRLVERPFHVGPEFPPPAGIGAVPGGGLDLTVKIGRAEWMERVCRYVVI